MIEASFLDELARFDTRLNRRLSGTLTGEQQSQALGEGRTFSDYRRYAPGDDTRLVDWKVYARTEELYVKQFESERDLTMHLLVDATGSMDFGAGSTNKFEFAAKIAIGFAYLAVAENNDFRVALVTDTARRLGSDRSNRGAVFELIDECNAVAPAGEGDLGTALREYAVSIDSRSLVLVASDFLTDPDSLERGLAALSRNECTLAHVLAPAERDPPAYGDTIFEGLEQAIRTRTYFGPRRRQQYQRRLTAHVAEIGERSEATGARHVEIDTGEDFFGAFVRVWPG